MSLTLDIGCGYVPRGDVNVDLLVKEEYPFQRGRRYNAEEDLSCIPNFVIADACFLPFKDKCFSRTLCFHVLEHIMRVQWALKELNRVTMDEIEIRVPYSIFERIFNSLFFWLRLKEWKQQYHLHEYSKKSFLKSLQVIFERKTIRLSYGYISFLHGLSFKVKRNPIVPLPFPYEVVANIKLHEGEKFE